MKILLTGGAGFIGSNLVHYLLRETEHEILNLDKLTYAGNPQSLESVQNHPRHQFIQTDLCDAQPLREIFSGFRPDAVLHLAAESHVDRSIDGPAAFIQTNFLGTFNLLQAAREYWTSTDGGRETKDFRFLHVSTDEVYGSLGAEDPAFSETTPYNPHSPYSASKASSDHLARAWYDTYGLPSIVTNCSNNYGPFQFPEKLIPVVILKCLRGEPIPVYGKGENIRDWLYVEDHCRALVTVLEKGTPGETYNIGGNNERQNIELVRMLCRILDSELGISNQKSGIQNHESLITFVTDRPGHDLRYAIDASKIRNELGWQPKEDFESGFRKTVRWYLDNRDWWEAILSGDYKLERLGASAC